ncbi:MULTISPECIES: hypothetical protein [Xanthomonas]|uniref:hypothetical protein n=2 Tax=Xanthomonas TaxID=338 RepID=UPI0013C31D7C|nr:hypothetical protein [Xanthomonas campestris]MBV6778305.1 hypothetical protein [Xanthomonas campestris pv. carissae]
MIQLSMDAADWKKVPGKLPESGSILWCYFEYRTATGVQVKHAQRHPVLVLANAVDGEGNEFLIVAGGTSVIGPSGQKRHIGAGDFVVWKRSAGTGYKKHGVEDQLVSDTKFSLVDKDVLALPYTERWFYTPPGCSSPRIGKVLFDNRETSGAFKSAAAAAKLAETLAARQNQVKEKETEDDTGQVDCG